jgi:hypothetical protein
MTREDPGSQLPQLSLQQVLAIQRSAAAWGLPPEVADRILRAMTFQQQYEDTKQAGSLTPAINLWRWVLDHIGNSTEARFFALRGLGLCLHERYTFEGNPADLEDAIEAYEEITRQEPASASLHTLTIQYLDQWLAERSW